jgi:outer membrane protein assembly factor BamD (BamD/ComL family)
MRLTLTILLVFFCLTTFSQTGKSKQKKPQTLQYADSLFLSKNWSDAIPIYEMVLKKEPANSMAWNRLVFSYHNLSNYDKAAASYLSQTQQWRQLCNHVWRVCIH